MKKTWAFLWITDLHYEQPEANYLDDAKEIKGDCNLPLRDDTFADFQATLKQDFSALSNVDPKDELSFIAIGGDITTHGKANGFTRFLREALPSLQRSVEKTRRYVSFRAITTLYGAWIRPAATIFTINSMRL